MKRELSIEQKKKIARILGKRWSRFWGLSIDGREEFRMGLYGLFTMIYELHLDGRTLSKSATRRYLSVTHPNTVKEYLEEARERGYIIFVRSTEDKRTIRVHPTEKLLELVRGDIEAEIVQFSEIIRLP